MHVRRDKNKARREPRGAEVIEFTRARASPPLRECRRYEIFYYPPPAAAYVLVLIIIVIMPGLHNICIPTAL